MRYEENFQLLQYNTFGIPCVADAFGEYETKEELAQLLKKSKRHVLHIGGGSNLLFLHPRFQGLVLHSAIKSMDIVEESNDYVVVSAGAGIVWDDFVAYTLKQGWYGLENLSYIPGEVGASAVQNVGAYGAEAGEFIVSVECLNLNDFSLRTFTQDECQYAYRYSIFKSPEQRGQWAVLSVNYRLSKHFNPRLDYGGVRSELERQGIDVNTLNAMQLRDCIVSIRQTKLPDPKVQGSAGSFFKNPIVPRKKYEELSAKYPQMQYFEVGDDAVKIPAGWMIDQCGWKGRKLGRAAVHDKQALVLVNAGGAEGEDIVLLCEAIRKSVKERFGIDIDPEVNFI